jgi:hypothetical protein
MLPIWLFKEGLLMDSIRGILFFFKHIDFSGKKSTESAPNTVYIAVYTGSCMALFTSTQLTPHVGVGTHILSFFLL